MDAHPDAARPELEVLENVRCLDCGAVYSKPSHGGVVQINPGCPECGYVGWISAAIPFRRESWPHRSDADLLLLPHGQSS